MAICETTHWILDCGKGHDCYMVEYRDTGALAAWGCFSEPVKGRPKLRTGQPSHFALTDKLQFCCTDMKRSNLRDAVSDLVPFELSIAEGSHDERVSCCVSGTIEEILSGLGIRRK
jgi:hypothetical protein